MEIKYNQGPRVSGRSFRHAMWSLLQASEGKQVIYISSNNRMAKWHFNNVCSFIEGRNVADFAVNCIVFPTGGAIHFTTINHSLEGKRVDAIALDVEDREMLKFSNEQHDNICRAVRRAS